MKSINESVFVGYRYYATVKKRVRYPFGYGLSYTTFEYWDMKVRENGEKITVSCEVANNGINRRRQQMSCNSIVKAPQSNIFKPERELRAFQKVYVKAGESVKVELTVSKADLRYFDIKENDWVSEAESMNCNSVRTVKRSFFQSLFKSKAKIFLRTARKSAKFTPGRALSG